MAIQMTKRYFSDIFDLCPHPQFLAHSFEISLGPRPLGASFVIIFGRSSLNGFRAINMKWMSCYSQQALSTTPEFRLMR